MLNKKKLTIETLIYCASFFAALALRLLFLGKAPLGDHEASLAMLSRSAAEGGNVLFSGEPGYLSLTTSLFYLLNDSAYLARFVPALFGSLIVVTPIFYRKFIGRLPALILAILFTLDPVLISTSRLAGGGMLALTGIIFGFGFLTKQKPILCGISFGLALLGGVDLWPGLIAIGLALILSGNFPVVKSFVIKNDENADRLQGLQLRIILISILVTAAGISSLFLIRVNAISAIGSSLVEFLQSWGAAAETPFYAVLIIWISTQLPGIILGLWALVKGLMRKDVIIRFLGLWWLFSLVLVLVNPTVNLRVLFWVSVPMFSLAALQISALFENWRLESRIITIAQAISVIVLIGFAFLNFTNLFNSPYLDATGLRNRLIGTILPLILLVVVTVLFAWGWSVQSARKGLLIGFVILLSLNNLGMAWKATGLGNRPENEPWTGSASVVGEDLLTRSVSDLSQWQSGQKSGIDIEISGLSLPSLEWVMRENLVSDNPNQIATSATSSIIITPIDMEIQTSASYRGQKIVWSTIPDYANMDIKAWLKWVYYRSAPTKNQEVILWARNDLFEGTSAP